MLKSLIAPIVAYFSKLRFPTLFKIFLVVFVLDLVSPDFLLPLIPFDEILLGLGTALLASWKKRKDPEPPAE